MRVKDPDVVCPVCLSYQPMLRCLLTLTSIVLIQSFYSTQRLQRGCGCEYGSRSHCCIRQPGWTSGNRRPLNTDVRIFELCSSIKGSEAVSGLKSVVGSYLLYSTYYSIKDDVQGPLNLIIPRSLCSML